jgi:hypothetical protein
MIVASGTSLKFFLYIVPLFFYAPSSPLFPFPDKIINILCMPLDEGNTDSLVTRTEVWASARIVDLQYWIYSKLQANMFIRYSHHSPIFILPMKNTPTVDDIQKEDHAVLRNNTMLPSQFSLDAVLDYFRVQDFDTIHFLVWLPPKNSESLC